MRAMKDQADAQFDFSKLNLEQQKLAQKEKTDQARRRNKNYFND